MKQAWAIVVGFLLAAALAAAQTHTVLTNDQNFTAANGRSITGTYECSGAGTISGCAIAGGSGSFSGNASTATALASAPTKCSANQATIGIDTSGNAQGCFSPITLPGGSSTQLQYNNAGVFGGIAGSSFSGGTVTLDNVANAVSPLVLKDNGVAVYTFADVTGTAAVGFTFTGSATGASPTLGATGSDTDIGIALRPKGAGFVTTQGTSAGAYKGLTVKNTSTVAGALGIIEVLSSSNQGGGGSAYVQTTEGFGGAWGTGTAGGGGSWRAANLQGGQTFDNGLGAFLQIDPAATLSFGINDTNKFTMQWSGFNSTGPASLEYLSSSVADIGFNIKTKGTGPFAVYGNSAQAFVVRRGTTDPAVLTNNGTDSIASFEAQDNGVAVFDVANVIGTAVNGVSITGGATTVAPIIAAMGETNVDLAVNAKGTGFVTHNAPVVLGSYTVTGLPTCGTTRKGALATVTDANAACVFVAAPAGGGTTVCPVYCDGTNWLEG